MRLREEGPPTRDANEPIRLRSVMTVEHVSHFHLATRDGFERIRFDLDDRRHVSYVSTCFIQKSEHFAIFLQSLPDSPPIFDLRIGFLPAHDFSVDESRLGQMDGTFKA